MKFGMRTPSLKKMIKARTTSKMKIETTCNAMKR